MNLPDETPGTVEQAIERARAHEPEPPAWFVATVMRRVHAWEGGQSVWRRWRRALRASNFSPAPRVGMAGVSIHTGGMAMKKVAWTVATLGALAIAAYVWLGYPSVGQGTDATIGAAQRYQAQPAATPAPAADASVQAFMQTDTFDRLMKNADTRQLLERAAADAAFRRALAEPAVRAALAEPAFQRALAEPAFRRAIAEPALSRAIAEPAMRRELADANMKRALAEPALQRALAEPALSRALAEPALQRAMADANFSKALAEPAMQKAMADAAFLRALAEPAMQRALAEPAFHRGLAEDAFSRSLRSR